MSLSMKKKNKKKLKNKKKIKRRNKIKKSYSVKRKIKKKTRKYKKSKKKKIKFISRPKLKIPYKKFRVPKPNLFKKITFQGFVEWLTFPLFTAYDNFKTI